MFDEATADGWIRRSGKSRTVLLLGVLREAMLRLAPQLKHQPIELIEASDAHTALAICGQRRVDLILVRHPVDGMAIDELLGGIRDPDGRSTHAYALVITREISAETLSRLGDRRCRFIDSSEFDVIVAVVAGEVLGVAPRVPSRLMVELVLGTKGARVSRFCQVANLSESGVLVRTNQPPPCGEDALLVFSLPEAPQPIRVEARVVRRTESHEVDGVALRFLEMSRFARARIRAYVTSRLAACG